MNRETQARAFMDPADLLPPVVGPGLRRVVGYPIARLFGFPALWHLHRELVGDKLHGSEFAERALEKLGVSFGFEEGLVTRFRDIGGPVVVVANHPFGGIDSLALLILLERARPGCVKLFSNAVLTDIPGLRTHLIAVDPLGTGTEAAVANRRGMMAARRHLRSGGVLGMFPAGRVSHQDDPGGPVEDRPWTLHPLRLAEASGATLVCLHIPGGNRPDFLRIPKEWARLRALCLCRELSKSRGKHVEIRQAAVLPPAEIRSLLRKPDAAARLRAWCYLRAERDKPRPRHREGTKDLTAPITAPASPKELRSAVAQLREIGKVTELGRFELLLGRGDQMPLLLQELGKLRELTFRAAGQGTGRPIDLAAEDEWYHHLLLWDEEAGRLAGAYRIGIVREILEARGPAGLYLDHVFRIEPDFYEQLGAAFELSRSFVHPDYQGDPQALAALWRGLGHAAMARGVRTLFGSVTISNAHHPASRSILVKFLRSVHGDDPAMSALVQARQPFRSAPGHHEGIAAAFERVGIDRLDPLIRTLEDGERGIPPLMRYYAALGARFLAYHVEASFADALYCLLRVDLDDLPRAYRRRFLGDS